MGNVSGLHPNPSIGVVKEEGMLCTFAREAALIIRSPLAAVLTGYLQNADIISNNPEFAEVRSLGGLSLPVNPAYR